jgi:pimeloyl-ACP methyl ester carboxylesterase
MIAVAVIGALPVLNVAVTVAIYVILRLYAPASVVGTDFDSPYRWWSAGSECLALLAQFMVIAPFERWWMGADTVRPLPAGRLPVLLVHGYLCNRGLWWWLRRGLRADHIEVATLNLEPPLAGIDHFGATASAHRGAGGGNRSRPGCARYSQHGRSRGTRLSATSRRRPRRQTRDHRRAASWH